MISAFGSILFALWRVFPNFLIKYSQNMTDSKLKFSIGINFSSFRKERSMVSNVSVKLFL